MRFLLSRRWILFAVTVGLLAFGAVQLGDWQFRRLHDRERRIGYIEINLAADPVPVTDVLSADRGVRESQEWMRVRLTGTYDAAATVVVRYQTRDGRSGVDLVTPLRSPDGTAVLVDRGWVPTANNGDPADLPDPPAGTVEVLGWVRADAEGRGTDVSDGSTRAVSSRTIAETLSYPVLRGFVDAETETPAPAEVPARAETPDLGTGPHLFYGIQWWFFGALAVFGFGYLAYDEARGGPARKRRKVPAQQ